MAQEDQIATIAQLQIGKHKHSSKPVTRFRIVRRFRTKIADAGLNAAVEGRDSTDWMLVDMGPMVVHLFTQVNINYITIFTTLAHILKDSRLETNLEAQWLLRFSNPELMDEEDREMYLAQQEP